MQLQLQRRRLLPLLLAPAVAGGPAQDGTAWGWGGSDSYTTFHGALGVSAETLSSDSPLLGRPMQLDELDNSVAMIAAGRDHTVVLRVDGSVYTFGSGLDGQLGHGDLRVRTLPTRVSSSSLGSDVVYVAAGSGFTVVVVLNGKRTMTDETGSTRWRLYSWGVNDWGQLGQGHRASSTAPRAVWAPLVSDHFAAEAAPMPSVLTVRAGGRHTLVLLDDGRVFGFGANEFGQLGMHCASTGNPAAAGCAIANPVQLAVGVWPDWIDCAVGGDHSVLLSSAGKLWVSGRNAAGQLGLGDSTDRSQWMLLELPGSPIISPMRQHIAAGRFHTLAMGSSGKIYGWGSNSHGELGLGSSTTDPIKSPTMLSSVSSAASAALLSAVNAQRRRHTRLAAGDGFSCFAVLSGDMVCAGRNDASQLATPSVTVGALVSPPVFAYKSWQSPAPPPVAALAVGAAGRHAFLLLGGGCDDVASTAFTAQYTINTPGLAGCTCRYCLDGTSVLSGVNESICKPCAKGEFGIANRCPVWCPGFRRDRMCTEFKAGATNCDTCASGRFSDAQGRVGALSCELCRIGRFSATARSTECADCSPGMFGANAGMSACALCGGGKWASGGAGECSVCLAGRASAVLAASAASSCALCPAGTQSRSGASVCTNCSAGMADTDRNPASQCQQCSVGEFAAQASTSCALCFAGTADTDLNPATACKDCSTGQYTANGSTACEDCWAGRVDEDQDPGTACSNCSVGHYSGLAATDCTPCTGGNVDDDLSPNTPCTRCQAGRYQALVEFTVGGAAIELASCADCALGKYSAAIGALSEATCIACEAGTADIDSNSATECQRCGGGRFAQGLGGVLCEACPMGKYSSAEGATSNAECLECSAGLVSQVVAAASADACQPCLPGTVYTTATSADAQILGINFACQACAAGRFSASAGATGLDACAGCTAGSASIAGSTACASCAPGFFAGPLAEQCLACGTGQFSSATRDACELCEAGQYSAAGAVGGSCTDCARGQYSPQIGANTCVECAAGQYAAVAGNQQCTACALGFASSVIAAKDAFVCNRCLAGFFAENTVVCRGCEAGKHSLELAVECQQCEPGAACLGFGNCSIGYTGQFCSSCDLDFFRMNGKCNECPNNNAIMIILALVLFLLCALLVLRLGSQSRKTNSLTAYGDGGRQVSASIPVSIFLTEMQINLNFFLLDVNWPAFVTEFMTYVRNVISFDFPALAAPECAIQFESAGASYAFRCAIVALGLPGFCGAIALLYLGVNTLISLSSQRCDKSFLLLLGSVPRETANACVIAWSTMYVLLFTQAIKTFHCVALDIQDAAWRLNSQREVLCTLETGWWGDIFGMGSFMLLVYGLLMPIAFFRYLYTKQVEGKAKYAAPAEPELEVAASVDMKSVVDSTDNSSGLSTSATMAGGADSAGEKGEGAQTDAQEPSPETPQEARQSAADKELELALVALRLAEGARKREEAADTACPIQQDRYVLDMMGWLYIRFRARWWWFEFAILARKAGLATVVVFLGRTGVLALTLTITATLLTLHLHRSMKPFREDTQTFDSELRYARARAIRARTGEGCCTRAWRSIRYAWHVPSLNGLQSVALCMQLVTLACGIICLASGESTSSVAIFAGWVALGSALAFILMMVRYLASRNFFCGCVWSERRPTLANVSGIGSEDRKGTVASGSTGGKIRSVSSSKRVLQIGTSASKQLRSASSKKRVLPSGSPSIRRDSSGLRTSSGRQKTGR